MQRSRDIIAGTVLGIVLMLAAINWADGANLTAILVLAIAIQGLGLYVAISLLPGKAEESANVVPMKRATVRFGGKRVTFPPGSVCLTKGEADG